MYSKIFPLLSKGIYLNTAYVGLMSKGLVQFRANNEKDYLQKGYYPINIRHLSGNEVLKFYKQ